MDLLCHSAHPSLTYCEPTSFPNPPYDDNQNRFLLESRNRLVSQKRILAPVIPSLSSWPSYARSPRKEPWSVTDAAKKDTAQLHAVTPLPASPANAQATDPTPVPFSTLNNLFQTDQYLTKNRSFLLLFSLPLPFPLTPFLLSQCFRNQF